MLVNRAIAAGDSLFELGFRDNPHRSAIMISEPSGHQCGKCIFLLRWKQKEEKEKEEEEEEGKDV